jgi:lysophospholipase L1-like esterase
VLTTATVTAVSGVAFVGAEVLIARSGIHLPVNPHLPSEAPAGPPGTSVDTVVWLGDSTASGVGASLPTATLPEQTAILLARPVRLTVLARSGARVADVLHDQLPRLARLDPTVVFISVGANDTTHLTPRGTFRRDYLRVLTGLPAGIRSVVLLGVPDMGASSRVPQPLRWVAGWRGRALDADVRHLVAGAPRIIYVDIAGKAGPAFRAHPRLYLSPDRYHPSDAGYGLWAKAVAEGVASAGAGA